MRPYAEMSIMNMVYDSITILYSLNPASHLVECRSHFERGGKGELQLSQRVHCYIRHHHIVADHRIKSVSDGRSSL